MREKERRGVELSFAVQKEENTCSDEHELSGLPTLGRRGIQGTRYPLSDIRSEPNQ